ncbi:MAG: hypothetical protein Kow006_24510 [Gammaproteobacteria bacterium]
MLPEMPPARFNFCQKIANRCVVPEKGLWKMRSRFFSAASLSTGIVLGLLLSLLVGPGFGAPLEIRVPTTGEGASRDAYQYRLLRLLLDKSGVDYRIQVVPMRFTQARVVVELERGELINLYWMGTSPEMEQRLLPVYFPVFKGLLGYRLFIIHKERQEDFARVTSLAELREMVGGQGIGWADVAILEQAGLRQRQAPYDTIIGMVNADHLDYFSRAVTEIYPEVEEHARKYPDIRVEQRLLLYYPLAMFFFVSPKHPELAEALRRGVERAHADGSFDHFFYTYPAVRDALDKANLDRRLRLEIPNPQLTDRTRRALERYRHILR